MTAYLLPIIAFLLSIACGFIFIPLILNFCKEKRLYDIPNSRKIHSSAVPRLGGICFLPSMLIALVITTFAVNGFTGYDQVTFSLWSLYFFVSLLLIYGVGLVDDLIGLNATHKFTVQIIAAALMPLSGLFMNNLYGFLGIYELPYAIGSVMTVFVIVFTCNAINLIDGIDGLSASLSFIALSGFLYCFFREDIYSYAILIAGLMGVLVPFLYFNLFGSAEKNRKIFMGDSGSLTLGFILGFLTVKASMHNPNVMPFHRDSLMLSYTLTLVPVFDVVRVILVRTFHRRPLFSADKNHIHHKLMRAGLTQHQTLLVIIALSLFYIVFNYILFHYCYLSVLVAVDIVVWMMFHYVVNVRIRKNGLKPFQTEE